MTTIRVHSSASGNIITNFLCTDVTFKVNRFRLNGLYTLEFLLEIRALSTHIVLDISVALKIKLTSVKRLQC